MHWLHPANAIACAAFNVDRGDLLGVSAFASMDRLFAGDLYADKYLQNVLNRLKEGDIDPEMDLSDTCLCSALLSIVRALKCRAKFAFYQKLRLLKYAHQFTCTEENRSVIKEADKEIESTLEFVKEFQEAFSPELDTYIKGLEKIRKYVAYNNPTLVRHCCDDDDGTIATEGLEESDENNNVENENSI